MLSFCYEQIVQECRTMNALPVCIFLPTPSDKLSNNPKVSQLLKIADAAGFVVLDLSGIYSGQDPNELVLTDPLHHSNAKANRIIAEALYDRLTTDPRIALLERARALSGGGNYLTALRTPSKPSNP
jgi:hypothetical protein